MAFRKLLQKNDNLSITKEQANEWVANIIDYVEFLVIKHPHDYYKLGFGKRILCNIGYAAFVAGNAFQRANIKEGVDEYKKFHQATLSILKHPEIFTNEHKNKILDA